jgi:hypothetical protein
MNDTRELEVGSELFVLLEHDPRWGVLTLGVFTSEAEAERRAASLRTGKSNAFVHVTDFEG